MEAGKKFRGDGASETRQLELKLKNTKGEESMKKVLMTLALALSMSAPAFAATTIGDWATDRYTATYEGTQISTVAAGKSANGVVFTRHNMSSYGEHYQVTATTTGTATKQIIGANATPSIITTEVCVFCHTPHFGQTTSAPLWNRGTSMTGYTAYGATGTNVAGTTLAGTATNVSGSSLACLSCHDGVTTFDNLINKPGKGARTGGTGTDSGWFMTEVGSGDTIGDTTASGSAKDTGSRLAIGGAGTAGTRDVANVDLSNDHPIAVAYTSTVASLRPTTTTISSITMDNARLHNNASAVYGRSDNLWAVKGYISDTATIADLLRDGGKVGCSSCHDPHYKNQTNDDPAVVCSWLPSLNNYGTAASPAYPFYGGPYVDEVATPSTEGCMELLTGYDKGAISVAAASGGGTVNVDPVGNGIVIDDYVGAKDSDGLFLRRVGGNSNSGVCRTCHNK